MRRILYLISVTIILLCSCYRDPIWHTLNQAESIMEEHPDSALILLTGINELCLTGETQAYHALLLSQAYDKTFIDITNDSLISIAVNYYNTTADKRNQMRSCYYQAVVYMNKRDYNGALTEALDVEKLAKEVGEITYLARIRMLIARAYLFSYNLEGAEEYLNESLHSFYALGKSDWIGIAYYNLANLEQYRQNYSKTLEYIDSVKKRLDYDEDVVSLELFAYIGMEQYQKADSVYTAHESITTESPQLRAYHTLIRYRLKQQFEYSFDQLFNNASHYDSLEIASVARQIALSKRDYKNAWKYTEFLRKESDKVITDLSSHSLYRTQIERDKYEKLKINSELQNKKITTNLTIIISILVCLIFIAYLCLLKKSHRAKILSNKHDLLLISSELSNLQQQHTQEIEHLNTIRLEDTSTIHSLREQIQSANIAAQALFMDKYSWIEELGNIFLDAEASKTATNRAMKGIKKRLESVKNTQFLPQLIDVINHYRGNLINRIIIECPSISESERNIIALLCANLSTRIVSFILDIKSQSIYNAKSSIKRKLETSHPEFLKEMSDIFPHK